MTIPDKSKAIVKRSEGGVTVDYDGVHYDGKIVGISSK